jgi:two-component system response regulator DevR
MAAMVWAPEAESSGGTPLSPFTVAELRVERPVMDGPEEDCVPGLKSGTNDGVIRVYLLDDHEVVRRGLRDLLEQEDDIEVVGESGSAVDATHRIPALKPDVAVLDGRLPDGSGIDVCRDVRSVDPSIKALILTSYEDDEALFAAIMAGAAGYVLKQVRGNDLVDGIRRVAAGQSLLDPAVTARVLERIRKGPEQPDELRDLTDQERKILLLVAEGLTNREIAGRMFLAEKTVKNYVSSLLAKLGLERRTQAAVLASKLFGTNRH